MIIQLLLAIDYTIQKGYADKTGQKQDKTLIVRRKNGFY
jgi:hypothetical protein